MDSSRTYYPLTHPQKAMWFTEKLHLHTSIGNIAGTLRIKEKVDYPLLEKAINAFIKKNDSMRLRIAELDGEPRQYFSEYACRKIDFFDFSEKDSSELYKWDIRITSIPFKLTESDLFYFAMVKISENDGGFYVKCHHLISDAWTMSLLGDRIIELYTRMKSGDPIDETDNLSYLNQIRDEEAYFKSDRFLKDAGYWKEKLSSFSGGTALKSCDPDGSGTQARRKTMLVPKKLSAKIYQYCAERKVSVFTLFISALSMYLNRIKAYEDIILGTTTLNRLNAKDKAITGMFINIAPIRININGDMDFDTLVDAVTREGMSLLRHQKYPYDFLMRDMREKYRINDKIFDIVLIYQNTRLATKSDADMHYTTRWHFNGYQTESLRININDRENDGHFIIDYDFLVDLFHVKEIDFLHQNVVNILWHALDNPVKKISGLEMLSEREKNRILYDFTHPHILSADKKGLENLNIPIKNGRRFHILDKNLNLLPIGIPGELFVAFGDDTELNFENTGIVYKDIFPNPFRANERLYRTGVLARWFPDGDILYLGRTAADASGIPAGREKKMAELRIGIAATFTAEPIGDPVKWWCGEFGYDADISFAGYNQVFQELLSPDSLLSSNEHGINLLLVRFEDFIRDDTGDIESKMRKLDRLPGELEAALKKYAGSAPLIVPIFPAASNLDGAVRDRINALNGKFEAALAKFGNVLVMDLRGLAATYGIREVFDGIKDREGHMPFTDEYYAAVGTEAARKIVAARRQHFKVIVLDCDNTLWKGVCGEQGEDGISTEGPYKELQEFMLKRREEGMLLAICSRNNKEDVYDVFENNGGMVLKKEHFASLKIDWNEKSRNIRDMAEELNLGLDSFIFVDDSPVECSKMVENCPEVLTLLLPPDETLIPVFLRHVWAFDRGRLSKEDSLRTRFYEDEAKRKELEKTRANVEDYIKSLQLKVSMRPTEEAEIGRAAQLTQRTNQFNFSTRRRNEEEIKAILGGGSRKCFTVEASDRFGTYGIIGLVILESAGGRLVVDTFLLSCRILGRNVEDVVLSGIRRYAEESGKDEIVFPVVPSGKNGPVLEFVRRLAWSAGETAEGGTEYLLKTPDMPRSVDFVSFYYNQRYEDETGAAVREKAGRTAAGILKTPEPAGEDMRKFAGELTNTGILNGTKHREYLLPLKYFSGAKLLKLPGNGGEPAFEGEWDVPGNETEKKLSRIWGSIFNMGRVGANSGFFECGGDSLNAVILISRIYKEFDVELTLKDIFNFNTIGSLAKKIEDSAADRYTRIIPVEKREYYELSSAQRRMYILYLMQRDSAVYNECQKVSIKGEVDKKRLEKAFAEFIRRHEALRTGFEMLDGRPVQKIYEDFEFDLPCIKAGEHEIDRITREFIKAFDLSRPPLIKAALVEIEKERHILLFDAPHIVIDGASFGILVREILSIYEGREPEPVKIQYKDFAHWQNELLDSDYLARQKDYWIKQFEGDIPVLNMPTDKVRPATQSFSGKREYFRVGRDLTAGLKKRCGDTDTTLFMVLFSAFGLLLQRYSGQEDIIIGTPVSGRRHADFEGVVGMFVNTLPVRTRPLAGKSLLEYLDDVKEAVLSGLENQDYQYESLIEKLGIKRDRSRNPLFDVMFSFRNFEMPAMKTDTLEISLDRIEPGTARFDISMTAREAGEGIDFELEYCTDLFECSTVRRMAVHFQNILKAIAEHPQVLISQIEVLSPEEKHGLIYGFNDTKLDYPKEKTIHELFEEQAERTPDHVAVVFEDKELTYRELNIKANQLAGALRSRGVKPDTVVGIMVERSLEMIVGILAILKAGGAYLPIDPQYPADRTGYMLENSGTRLLLTQKSLAGRIKMNGGIICCDDPELYAGVGDNLENVNTSGDLMYVIYTSGSTGKPKGVMLEHRNISNFIAGMRRRILLEDTDVLLCLTTISFDIFVLETWYPLTAGVKLVVSNETQRMEISSLSKTVVGNRVSVVQMTPSRMKLILEDPRSDEFIKGLRMILLGGEPLPQPLFETLRSRTRAVIFNMYGPTETAVWSSVKDMTNASEITLGEPIANTRFYILDKSFRVQPLKIPGELFIAGDGLARGYINNEALTNQKYVRNPFEPGSRMYGTGDVVVMNENREIAMIGRADNQVKLAGYRIELSEIESVLSTCDGIKECVAVLSKGSGGPEYLCVYFTAAKPVGERELKDFLLQKLPFYMIPKKFVRLKEIPLTGNGKVDRKELERRKPGRTAARELKRSEGEVQKGLEEIFKRILNIEHINISDSFFEMGGDSLQSIKLIIEIYNHFNVEISYTDLVNSPTVEALGFTVSGKLLKGYGSHIDIGSAYSLLNGKKPEGIFAFPPITGFGLAFNNMSKQIEDYSLYAFNYLEGGDKIKRYYSMIKAIQKRGPYILLGFSAGADIVVKLAEMMEEDAVVILMDGFWGEVKKDEIEEKLKFFIKYSMNYAGLDENVFLHRILEKRIRSYMLYLAEQDKFKKRIHNDIHFIQSEEMTDAQVDSLKRLTTGSLYRYKAAGRHFDLLQNGFVERNAGIIMEIIETVRLESGRELKSG